MLHEINTQINNGKLYVYHYTTPKGWYGMNNGKKGWLVFDTNVGEYVKGETLRGLLTCKRFVPHGFNVNLPKQAHNGIWEGVLTPIPQWDEYRYPKLFGYLMHDICREDFVILLRVEIKPDDKVFVFERAYLETILYSKEANEYSKGYYKYPHDFETWEKWNEHETKMKELGKLNYRRKVEAYEKMYKSLVRVQDYVNNPLGYRVPTVCSFHNIPLNQLQVVGFDREWCVSAETNRLPILQHIYY